MDLVSFHVALVAVIVLCFAGLSLDRYYRRRLRAALHETLAFKKDLHASQQETQEARQSALDFHRLLVGTRVAYDIEAAVCRVELSANCTTATRTGQAPRRQPNAVAHRDRH